MKWIENFIKKPKDLNAFEINNLLEHYIFSSLIKSYAVNLFDENNNKKIPFEKEDLLDQIYKNKDEEIIKFNKHNQNDHMNSELSRIQSQFFQFIDKEVSFSKDNTNVVLKITNNIKSVFSFLGSKLGLTNKNKTVIDISDLALIPYEQMNTSTHVYLYIGGMFIGNPNRVTNNCWKKLFPVNKTVDFQRELSDTIITDKPHVNTHIYATDIIIVIKLKI